ncbi:MAG TPA: response regulator [Rudaea sp.]|nr:response regulator [Rudaea sp.]
MNTETPLEGRRILVVEDDYFGAQALVGLLQLLGATTVGPIGWIEEAIGFVDKEHASFDSAVIDVNLHGEKSYALADKLDARGKYFVFATGYDADALDEEYRRYPRCEKPYGREALLAALLSSEAQN